MAIRKNLEGRAGEIWRLWCSGWTQEALAEKFSIDQTRVSQILADVRALIPETDRAELIRRELDFLDQARTQFMEIADLEAPPAFDQKGNVLRDPVTKAVVRDYSGRVAALKAAQETGDRMAKRLGLDAPITQTVTISAAAQDAAARLAAEALSRVEAPE